MAETYGGTGPNNPLLPDNADYNNQINRSGSTREAISDAGSRTADALSGSDDDLHLRSAGMHSSSSRYYLPNEGRQHLSGFFDTRDEAERAVNELERLGISRADISVVMRDAGEAREFAESTGTKAGEGAGTGSILGGTVGAILGALAATATAIAIPGAGIIIAGPIAGALAGAGAGGLTGGLLGALIGAGIPEEQARSYESGLSRGGVVVVADVPGHLAAEARVILSYAHG